MGQRIRRLREAKGWTQAEFARLVGVSRSTESQWELDQVNDIRLVNFLKVVELLGTDPAYLIWGPDRAPINGGKSAAGTSTVRNRR